MEGLRLIWIESNLIHLSFFLADSFFFFFGIQEDIQDPWVVPEGVSTLPSDSQAGPSGGRKTDTMQPEKVVRFPSGE